VDCEFSHEKDDSHPGDKGSQAWNQDGSAAPGSKSTEASASDWFVDGNEKNESYGWDDTGGQGSTDKWDENESGKDNDQWGTGREWDGLGADNANTTAEGNNETSRKGNRQSSSRTGDGWRRVCRDYLRGSCRRPGCRFLHETDDTAHHDWNKDDWVTRNPLAETSSKKEWTSENETGDVATGGDECDAPPSTTSRQGGQGDRSDQRTCWAYLRGQCHRTRCRFAHEPESDQQEWSSDWNTDEQVNTWDSSQNADAWNEQPSEPSAEPRYRTDHVSSYTSPGRGQETCLYFGQGFCPKGDSCPLLHVNSDDILSGENQEVGTFVIHQRHVSLKYGL